MLLRHSEVSRERVCVCVCERGSRGRVIQLCCQCCFNVDITMGEGRLTHAVNHRSSRDISQGTANCKSPPFRVSHRLFRSVKTLCKQAYFQSPSNHTFHTFWKNKTVPSPPYQTVWDLFFYLMKYAFSTPSLMMSGRGRCGFTKIGV